MADESVWSNRQYGANSSAPQKSYNINPYNARAAAARAAACKQEVKEYMQKVRAQEEKEKKMKEEAEKKMKGEEKEKKSSENAISSGKN
ncbi:hypothetical protein ACEPPN_006005 [Leptodophora sp. 'Broadleaf-Isolate-01']